MHEAIPLPFKPNRLDGLSERLLASHYENNYGGAVRRLNAIAGEIDALDPASCPGFLLNGLRREELLAHNSMVLHEAYFDALGGSGDAEGDLAAALERDFGSVARWRADFTAMGKALAGGSGWVLLARSARDGRLRNHWAADHAHVPAGGDVVLALDMYEHAYHLDFGARAGAYVDAFMRNVHWGRVGDRHRRAAGRSPGPGAAEGEGAWISVEGLRRAMAEGGVAVLDVRHREDFDAAPETLPGAAHRDARRVEEWAAEVPRDREVVVYCVYGFQVGKDAAAELRRRGVRARALAGGISAWRAMGGGTVPAP
jgi:Fe-Mn family superoxide dismutase